MGETAGIGEGAGNCEVFCRPDATAWSTPALRSTGSGLGRGANLAPIAESVSGPESTSDLVPPASAPQSGKHSHHHTPRWLVRAELVLRVMLRIYVGLAIFYAPWSTTLWDQNPIFAQFPVLSAYAANGAVRGLVSGLGILNLWIAFQSVIHRGEK